MNAKFLFAGFAALILCIGVQAAEPDDPGQPPPPDGIDAPPPPPSRKGDRKGDRQGERRGLGPSMWRAFTRLSEAQRQELLKLQSTDPDQFRTKMRELGEALRKEEQARFDELMKLVERVRASKDEKEKAVLMEQITTHIRAHYLDRLEDNKRQLEEMKKRTKELEEELKKREANADEIVKARAEALVRGERPEPDDRPPKPGKPDRQNPMDR